MTDFQSFPPPQQKNVFGQPLQACSIDPLTGFYRDGYCRTGADDTGRHIIAVTVTEEFLTFSKQVGNDLSTPRPEYAFQGLKAGDRWCLCALRWIEAEKEGVAPKVHLEATHENMLQLVSLETLQKYACA